MIWLAKLRHWALAWAMAGVAACSSAAQALPLPLFEQVKAAYPSSETRVLDRHGRMVQRMRTDFAARRGRWVTLAQVSPALLQIVVATEDKNFYAHAGVDWQAITAAAWANVRNVRHARNNDEAGARMASIRGASTITMQLAGLLEPALQPQAGRRSWRQKLAQAQMARELEQRWSKSQILEAYLNLAPFRGELVGVDALSQSLFGKQADTLDWRESAIAVALLRAPNAPGALVARRACQMLAWLQSPWGSDCQALALYTEAALRQRHLAAAEGSAPHFARYALRQWQRQNPPQQQQQQQQQPNAQMSAPTQAGAKQAMPAELVTSLDADLQQFASHTLQRQLAELAAQNVQDGAVLVLDNATGDVLAWVGSSGRQLSRAAEVDAVLAQRQPGSTLKPFLYAQAIAQRRLTAASLLEDAPARISTAHGLYIPQNYDVRFKGWVSVRQALAGSLNIPAVRTLLMVSPDAFAAQLRQLGLDLAQPAGYYGYSLALGGVDVSLLRLTNAYRTLANGGRHSPVQLLADAQGALPAANNPPGERVLDEGASFIVSDILADRHARAGTFGTGNPLATRFWSAVKTGTSKDMRDNWAIGYTRHFTIGVWVGNADGAPMHGVSGIAGAAPVWAAIARHLHDLRPGSAPQPPAALVRTEVNYRANKGVRLEAGRSEWFLPGTQQAEFVLRAADEHDRDAPASFAQAGQPANAQQGRQQPPARVPAGAAASSAVDSARIVQPEDGTMLALDPDIPAPHQLLRISSSHARVRWYLNGQEVRQARSTNHWFWQPQPGRFTLQLRDRTGKAVLDTATIIVRPASFAPR